MTIDFQCGSLRSPEWSVAGQQDRLFVICSVGSAARLRMCKLKVKDGWLAPTYLPLMQTREEGCLADDDEGISQLILRKMSLLKEEGEDVMLEFSLK